MHLLWSSGRRARPDLRAPKRGRGLLLVVSGGLRARAWGSGASHGSAWASGGTNGLTRREEVLRDAETFGLVRRYMAKQRSLREQGAERDEADESAEENAVDIGYARVQEDVDETEAVQYVCLTCAHRATLVPRLTDQLRFCAGCGGRIGSLV